MREYLFHCTAHGRSEKNVGILFVGEYGGAGEYFVTFLDKESRDESFEISWFDGNNFRNHRPHDFLGSGTLYRNVEALFQIDVVRHYE